MAKEMSILDDLTFASSGVLSIKEEVEINETQLQDQIFDGIRVNQSGEAEKRSEMTEDETISHHKYGLGLHMKSHSGNGSYACTTCHKKYSSRERLSKHKVIHNPKFKCTICEKSYYSRTKLNGHMNFHRGERPFKCEICPKSFTLKDRLLSHSKTHSGEWKYECTLCNKKSRSRSGRREHEKTHSNDHAEFQCEKCKKYFRLEGQYHSHLGANKCKGYAPGNPFQCSKCDNESFESIELLNQHKVEIHPPPKKNEVCSVCAKAFRYKYLLDFHMNIHTGSRPYTCATCSKTFGNPEYLRRHKFFCDKEVKARSRYKCTHCGKPYLAKRELSNHMNSHRGERPFKCQICSKPYMSQNALRSHKRTHSKERNYECTLCNKTFTYKSSCRKHEKTHSNECYNYQCDVCKRYFKDEDQLSSHLNDNKCKGLAPEMPFQCSMCGHVFESIELLNRHETEIHSLRKKNYTCSICPKSFWWKGSLEIHMNSHTGNRPHACTTCPKRFGTASNLRRHKLSCGEEMKRLKCTLCEKSYRSRNDLSSHLNFHRGERPFKCEICPKSFRSKDLLWSHKKTHLDDKKYECTLCNRKCRNKSDRLKHENTHLNDSNNYQCHFCKKCFKCENQFRSHSEDNKCNGNPQEFHDRENENCEKQIQTQNEIENVVETVEKSRDAFEKKYKCVECNKKFVCKRNLSFHLRSHTTISST